MLRAATHPELFDRAQWFAAGSSRREQLARAVEDIVRPDFEYLGLRSYAGTDLEIAVYRHLATGMGFSLIPGGSFEMGMSPEEEQAIVDARPDVVDDEDNFIQEFDLLLSEMATMRPLHEVTLEPFLLAQRVLDVGQVRRHIHDFVDPLYGDSPEVPAHLSNEQGIAVLVGTGLRLPSEAELEGAARGHLRRSLLPTSTRIPDEDSIEAILADEGEVTSNAFGIHSYGLYPERCADAWHDHYKGAPTDGSAWAGPGPRVVRGGAANCYPWQATGEWNVMLCAFRMSDHAAEFGAAIRPARSLRPAPAFTEPEHAVPVTRASNTRKATAKKASKKTASKTSAKKASKKTAAKKTTAKSASKKTAAKKTTAKPASKKATAKPASKKTAAKKTTTKPASNKTAAKKTTTKPAANKTAAKQATAKPASKKTAAKKANAKPASNKTAAKKTATNKTASNKTATNKTATNKPAAKATTKKPSQP